MRSWFNSSPRLRKKRTQYRLPYRLAVEELVIVGPDRCLDHTQVAAQDPVLVRARDRIQIGTDLADQLVGVAFVRLGIGIETAFE